jgi:hypothetical protein
MFLICMRVLAFWNELLLCLNWNITVKLCKHKIYMHSWVSLSGMKIEATVFKCKHYMFKESKTIKHIKLISFFFISDKIEHKWAASH